MPNTPRNPLPTPRPPRPREKPPRPVVSPLLDPHGIYGTRSANRVRTARRRRLVQGLLVLLVLALLPLGLYAWLRTPRVPVLRPVAHVDLMATVSTVPVKVQVAGQPRLLLTTETGNLLLLDPVRRTWWPLWQNAFPALVPPRVEAGVAYVGCADGIIYAVRLRDGHLLWQFQTGATISTRPEIVAFPVAHSTAKPVVPKAPAADAALAAPAVANAPPPPPVQQWPQKVLFVANDDGRLVALASDTGRLLWQRRLPNPPGDALGSALMVDGPLLLIPLVDKGARRGGLLSVRARNGQRVWRFPRSSPHGVAAKPAGAAQLPPPVVALSPGGTGGRLWCVDDSGSVTCLDIRTGSKVWKTYVAALNVSTNEGVLLRAPPLLLGGVLLAGGDDGGLRAITAVNGRPLWTRQLPGSVHTRATPFGSSTLLVGTDSGQIQALEPEQGRVLWQTPVFTAGWAAPVTVGRQMVVVTREGQAWFYNLAGL